MGNSHATITILEKGHEEILANQIDSDTYEVVQSSILLPKVTYGTTIKALKSEGKLIFNKIIKRSPYKTYSTTIPKSLITSEKLERIKKEIVEKGGQWEQLFSGLMIFHLPKNVNYNPIKILNE